MPTSSDGLRSSKRRKLTTASERDSQIFTTSPGTRGKDDGRRSSRRLINDMQKDGKPSISHEAFKSSTRVDDDIGDSVSLPECAQDRDSLVGSSAEQQRTDAPVLVKRGRGRPPKLSRLPRTTEIEPNAVERRRSARSSLIPDTHAERDGPFIAAMSSKSEQEDSVAESLVGARPAQESAVKLESEQTTNGTASQRFDTSAQAVDTRKRSATGKTLGRPRKSDSRQDSHIAKPSKSSDRPQKKTPKDPSKQQRASKESLTHSPSVLKKIKLRFGPVQPLITHPAHMPFQPLHGSLQTYLSSFISLDEDVSPEVAEKKRQAHQLLVRRVKEAEMRGILDDSEKPRITITRAVEPQLPQSHQDFLNGQATYFSKLMQEERRRNYSNARKIAAMVQAHFKRLSGADERQLLEDQRTLRQLAKRVANEIRRKWRLAEKEVQRRIAVKQQEVQRLAGKEHLNQILEHSTSLLDAQFSSYIEEETYSDDVSEGNEDHYLSVEQLRAKYADLPDINIPHIDGSDLQSGTDQGDTDQEVNSDDSSGVAEGLAAGARESDFEEPDSPMDSEYDSSSSVGSVRSQEDDAPGLSFLYPELMPKKTPVPIEAATSELSLSPRATSIISEDLTIRPKSSRASAGDLLALPSDEESEDESDNSPMDSEMDESEQSETDAEIDDGPGLSWLYSNPMTNKKPTNIEASATEPQDLGLSASATQSNQPQPVLDVDVQGEQPESISIRTPVPFLLRGVLREYQHMGLDWMAGLFLNGTNGILADEMGLGKTIQTISLLTWLACEKEIWGTHLIVVPTSVMLNWEMEFKKFAPALKVLTYYGNPKERKEKRRGWSRPDTVHIVITSYQLVITDSAVFRRKRWEYLILDEAHNIKNFKSQRWQTLLNFNTQHRLLLTGTPLQNNLNELWSLLYFLMPQGLSNNTSFAGLSDFQEWFARPVDKLIEDAAPKMDDEARQTIAKLHRILRPYILRRLKADVEKQMPGKYEHVVTCKLSKRQRFLYDDFMARSGTRAIMASGNFLSIINCFMQLRKVCNHPDLFESRPIITSFAMRKSAVSSFEVKELLIRRRLLLEEHSLDQVDLSFLNLNFSAIETKSKPLALSISQLSRAIEKRHLPGSPTPGDPGMSSIATKKFYLHERQLAALQSKTSHMNYINAMRCSKVPVYGSSFLREIRCEPSHAIITYWDTTSHIQKVSPSIASVAEGMRPLIARFACVPAKVTALDLPQQVVPFSEEFKALLRSSTTDACYFARTSTSIAFPDKRLLQFDCGKLQRLDSLLRELIADGHRVLIFTQMTKMLDILEQFLNIHGHRYFRLDGSTKIESRQSLTERFNSDTKIPVFILSTRSGGLGINLTGADTVIFYDSDWNPCMDRQCQDRAHRIGQTRDVHIYRFVSEYTIEQNIMRKANQKRMLDNVVIGEGDFTTDFLNKVDWRDMLGDEISANITQPEGVDIENALAAAEDVDDAQAAKIAQREMDVDAVEFAETGTPREKQHGRIVLHDRDQAGDAVMHENAEDEDEEEEEVEMGSIDDYMITFLEREMGVSA